MKYKYIIDMCDDFLTQRNNIIGLVALFNFLIGLTMWYSDLSTIQVIGVVVMLFINHFLIYTLGISKGIIGAEILRTLNESMKKRKKDNKKS